MAIPFFGPFVAWMPPVIVASLTAVAQNDAMKKLAGWAAIIGVPTMVAGIYGMNFKFMPELEWRYGYPAVMAGMIAACVFLYSRFKRSGWL